MRLLDLISPLELVMEMAEDPSKEQKLARQSLAAIVCIDNILKRKG